VREADYGREVTLAVAAGGLGDRVDLLGPLPSEGVRDELARAAVFALVSLEENAPMGIAEAMAAGVPVIASDRCGMPYMVRHGETGFLVDPLDVEELAARLAALLGDPGRRRRMGELARRLARDRFHPEVVARRTLDVYRDAVGGAPYRTVT
jgi:glycosyltransferase involved in cell wall biosynthesis